MGQRSREKEQKQQHINGLESILLKSCPKTVAGNYYQKSSGRPDSGDVCTSLRFRRFLAYTVSSRQLQIFERWDIYLKELASSTSNSSCDQNQVHVTFSSHLQKSRDVKHSSSINIPGTTTEWHATYNLQL
ncbi:hypothetical protein TNCV_4611781 [Trichonephila clavipes]|nr:hypothetical protein TNCV_4611781 [Trichonephila clavipes]